MNSNFGDLLREMEKLQNELDMNNTENVESKHENVIIRRETTGENLETKNYLLEIYSQLSSLLTGEYEITISGRDSRIRSVIVSISDKLKNLSEENITLDQENEELKIKLRTLEIESETKIKLIRQTLVTKFTSLSEEYDDLNSKYSQILTEKEGQRYSDAFDSNVSVLENEITSLKEALSFKENSSETRNRLTYLANICYLLNK